MAIFEYFQMRYNTGTGVLEYNVGLENWIPIPIGGGGSSNFVQNTTESQLKQLSNSDTNYVDALFGVTITPTTVNSKILITFPNICGEPSDVGHIAFTVYRGIGGVDLGAVSGNGLAVMYYPAAGAETVTSLAVVDTPNTTGPVTYELYAKSYGGTGLNINGDGGTKMIALAQELAS